MKNMSDQEIDEILKKEIPIDLLTEKERETAKSFTNMIDSVRYIHQFTDNSIKIAKTYYDLYIKDEQ